MSPAVRKFKQHLIDGSIVWPKGTHHEFAHGAHGQKIDFDLIPHNSPLYEEWIDIIVEEIKRRHKVLPSAVVGVANGTNRVARDVGAKLNIPTLITEKISAREVALTTEAEKVLKEASKDFALVLEDVASTGGTALTAAKSVLDAGVQKSLPFLRGSDKLYLRHMRVRECLTIQ